MTPDSFWGKTKHLEKYFQKPQKRQFAYSPKPLANLRTQFPNSPKQFVNGQKHFAKLQKQLQLAKTVLQLTNTVNQLTNTVSSSSFLFAPEGA